LIGRTSSCGAGLATPESPMTKSAGGQGASTEKFPMVPDKATDHVPTRTTRRMVCDMVSSDWPKAMIAKDMGISTEILKKHYRDELRNGRKLSELYAKMAFREVAHEKGSVAGLRTLAGIKADGRPVDEKPPERTRKPPALGKKEQRKLDAESVNGGVFATPATPRKLSLIGSKAN
jgi:hypothetical protein